MTRPDDPTQTDAAYDAFWAAAEAGLDVPPPVPSDPGPDPADTYAAFHDAADE